MNDGPDPERSTRHAACEAAAGASALSSASEEAGDALRACLKKHEAELSEACKAKVEAMSKKN